MIYLARRSKLTLMKISRGRSMTLRGRSILKPIEYATSLVTIKRRSDVEARARIKRQIMKMSITTLRELNPKGN
jgi:hypothetical protein